jgi:hypothetical protein
VFYHDMSGDIASDQTGALPFPWGKQYHMIMTVSDPNYIYVKVVPSLFSSDLLAAIKKGVKFYTSQEFAPILEKIDNAVAPEQEQFFHAAGITLQAMPAGSHRRNPAERGIRT